MYSARLADTFWLPAGTRQVRGERTTSAWLGLPVSLQSRVWILRVRSGEQHRSISLWGRYRWGSYTKNVWWISNESWKHVEAWSPVAGTELSGAMLFRKHRLCQDISLTDWRTQDIVLWPYGYYLKPALCEGSAHLLSLAALFSPFHVLCRIHPDDTLHSFFTPSYSRMDAGCIGRHREDSDDAF